MGEEKVTSYIKIDDFYGLNLRDIDTSIDIRESSGLQNVNISNRSLEQRAGSIILSDQFLDKTDTTAKVITGFYQTTLGGTVYQVGIGGDAIKSYAAGLWTDITDACVITDDQDNKWVFSTFFDTSANPIIIASNGVDAPIKWTGTGDAAPLATLPNSQNFFYQVVHKNKLWVSVDDIVYFSNFRDGETWDDGIDLIRYDHNGEDITGLHVYRDYVVVFQKTQISMISGSSVRDLYSQTIVTNDGTPSGFTIREVESRRYGNILVFLSTKDGTIKGFNGSPNLINLGYLAEPLFDTMNRAKFPQAVSGNYKKLGQYWLSLTYGGGSENDQIIIYDYKRDYLTNQKTGLPISSLLYHVGIKANYIDSWTVDDEEIFVTANYNGYLLQQDVGLLDEEAESITASWKSKKIDFGSATRVKLLSDLAIVSTQSSDTTMSLNVITQGQNGSASLAIEGDGYYWGELIWGTGLWSTINQVYTRAEITRTPSTEEGSMYGRYFGFQIIHSTSSENLQIDELVIGVTDLGDQQEYLES